MPKTSWNPDAMTADPVQGDLQLLIRRLWGPWAMARSCFASNSLLQKVAAMQWNRHGSGPRRNGAVVTVLFRYAAVLMFTLFSMPLAAVDDGDGKRPNIVFIMVDDQRFDQVSYMGHPYLKTPNIDRIAEEGAKFSRAYVTTPLCGPSRGSIFTGRLPSLHRIVNHNVWPGRYPEGDFMPGVMKGAGYATAMIGKWGMGPGKDPRPEFDKWFVEDGLEYPASLQPKTPDNTSERKAYYDEKFFYENKYYDGDKSALVDGYMSDLVFDEAIEFCLQDTDRPFLAMITPKTPHAPYNPAMRHKGLFKGKGLMDAKNRDLEKGFKDNPSLANGRLEERYERQCEMMLSIDEGVGRLYEALKQAGKLDDTIFIYTSDNGMMWGEHGCFWKKLPWEESVKVPLVIRYPKWFKPGTQIDEIMTLTDFPATFVSIAGGPPLQDAYGVDMVPFFTGKVATIRDEVVMQMFDMDAEQPQTPHWSSIVGQRYKYVAYSDDTEPLMFDLLDDPLEQRNLANDPGMVEKRAEMVAQLKQILSENATPSDWVK